MLFSKKLVSHDENSYILNEVALENSIFPKNDPDIGPVWNFLESYIDPKEL